MALEALLSQQIIGLSESIDDRVAALLVAGTGITLTYNDGAGTLTIAASSTGIGGSTASTDNAVLRADGTGGATLQNSAFVIADIATSSPNNTVNHASIQATGATSNVSVSVVPKGTGAFCLQVPDGTSAGGNVRGSNAIDLQTSRSAANQVASGSSSLAAGASNRASGGNSVALGFGNAATGLESRAIGYENTASGSGAIAIGLRNTVSGSDGTVALGDYNFVTQTGGLATGRRARADRAGQRCHAHNQFATEGDAQYTGFVLRNKTTNATPTTLFCDGSSARLTVNAGEIIGFVANIIGSKSDGSAIAHYVRKGAIKRVGTTTTLAYVETVGTDYEDNASTDVAITADDTNDALQINVTGIAGETWRWFADVQAADLGFGT